MDFWNALASREFLHYIQSIAESLEVIADALSKDNNQ